VGHPRLVPCDGSAPLAGCVGEGGGGPMHIGNADAIVLPLGLTQVITNSDQRLY